MAVHGALSIMHVRVCVWRGGVGGTPVPAGSKGGLDVRVGVDEPPVGTGASPRGH